MVNTHGVQADKLQSMLDGWIGELPDIRMSTGDLGYACQDVISVQNEDGWPNGSQHERRIDLNGRRW